MKQTNDLSWLAAPAFLLILGMLVVHSKKQHSPVREKIKTETTTSPASKQS